ncbi:MAG: hypothetical protein ABIG55_06640 [Candidatus Omnitrophota bacterium]|nr:hypothetical protein [Candidatus Omnitrophota bacterium]
MDYKSVEKNGVEFLLSSYSGGDKFLVLVIKDDRISPKYPFDSMKEAENWVEALGATWDDSKKTF